DPERIGAESADQRRIEFPGTILGNADRRDRSDDAAMGHRRETKHVADRKAHERYRLPLAHLRTGGQRWCRQWRALDSQHREIASILPSGKARRPYRYRPLLRAGHRNCQRLETFVVENLGKYMGVGCDEAATADRKARPQELERGASRRLKRAHGNDRTLDSRHGLDQ